VKEVSNDLKVNKLILQHPSMKKLKGAFFAGQKNIEVSGIKVIEDQFLRTFSASIGKSFIVTNKTEMEYKTFSRGEDFFHIIKLLEDLDFRHTEFCDEPGTYVRKGDTLTLYSFLYQTPMRLSFWGDELEDIQLIDLVSGRKVHNLNEVIVTGNCLSRLINPTRKFSGQQLVLQEEEVSVHFDFTDLPKFHSNLAVLQSFIDSQRATGMQVIVSSRYSIKLETVLKNVEFTRDLQKKGWRSGALRVMVLSDYEIFDSITTETECIAKDAQNLGLVKAIAVGDYVVHKDHGVAVYGGIKRINSHVHEDSDYMVLNYAKEDKLYVPMTQLLKVTKYIGDRGVPRLTRLGTHDWERVTKKVKKSIELISHDLLKLYAARAIGKSTAFSSDTDWQLEMESDFPYEETEDQLKAMEEIKSDMESLRPMDRLLVGDVGFGKTELAIRAAFKAVQDGMQVLLLAPTTILVEQHYAVFRDRLAKYPVEIETLSRFKGKSRSANVVEKLERGKVDIVIGTHRILSSDVKVRNLGLIIIDEEQRFGVKQKEKLKELRSTVDVLSMSATPIPRTLHMALSGIRDISVLAEPPKGRHPIDTRLRKFDYDIVSDVIDKECKRRGQVYFVHNDIRKLESLKVELEKRMPGRKFVVGHGQMENSKLASVMRGFYNHEYDVLLCTTIIENGIDLPNVNTIIIDDVQRFGLSQLHQLRGRVGRSGRNAYCFLLYPQGYDIKGTTKDRLEAIIQEQHLGAGFNIATKDLEIRGVGNLLGGQQSGNISSVGFSLYMQLLQHEIRNLRRKGM